MVESSEILKWLASQLDFTPIVSIAKSQLLGYKEMKSK
jgi:hypothetical protein